MQPSQEGEECNDKDIEDDSEGSPFHKVDGGPLLEVDWKMRAHQTKSPTWDGGAIVV